MPVPIDKMTPHEAICPATTFVALAIGAITPPTRSVYAGTDVTVSWTDFDGNSTASIAILAGKEIAVSITAISALTGSLYGLK